MGPTCFFLATQPTTLRRKVNGYPQPFPKKVQTGKECAEMHHIEEEGRQGNVCSDQARVDPPPHSGGVQIAASGGSKRSAMRGAEPCRAHEFHGLRRKALRLVAGFQTDFSLGNLKFAPVFYPFLQTRKWGVLKAKDGMEQRASEVDCTIIINSNKEPTWAQRHPGSPKRGRPGITARLSKSVASSGRCMCSLLAPRGGMRARGGVTRCGGRTPVKDKLASLCC